MSDRADPACDRITQAIADGIRAGEMGDTTQGIPTSWVFVGTYLDEDGESRKLLLTNDGAHVHETLGLLAFGTAVWNQEAMQWAHGNRTDEDE